MNNLLPGQQVKEKLLGVFDIRCKYVSNVRLLEALFRYEVVTMRHVMGGQVIVDTTDIREEWREVTERGCFPSVNQKYKVT